MLISFELPNQTIDLEIALIDNPAVSSWAQHFSNRQTRATVCIADESAIIEHDAARLQNLLDICFERVRELQNLGYTYTGSVWPQSINDIDRNFTNSLHRYFTHNQHKVNNQIWPVITEQQILDKRKDISRLLQDVNTNVHLIEQYMSPVPRVNLHSIKKIVCHTYTAYDDVSWWNMEPSHRQYHTSDHADVILDEDILGKSLLRSFLDGDNPVDWDTSGHYASSGGLQILLTQGRQQIYHSEEFHAWLAQHGTTAAQMFFDFPIGNIVDRSMLPQLTRLIRSTNQISVSAKIHF